MQSAGYNWFEEELTDKNKDKTYGHGLNWLVIGNSISVYDMFKLWPILCTETEPRTTIKIQPGGSKDE